MSVRVRNFEADRDYVDALSWWSLHKWDPQPLEALSSQGFIAETAGQKLAAVWLYVSDSCIHYLEFMVSNPKAPLRLRQKAVQELVREALAASKKCGGKLVFSSLLSRGLIREYERMGFVKGNTGMTNLIARVN